MQIRLDNPELEAWFLAEMSKAEAIISRALDKADKLGHFEKISISKAVYHASIIDMELIQLKNGDYESFAEDDVI